MYSRGSRNEDSSGAVLATLLDTDAGLGLRTVAATMGTEQGTAVRTARTANRGGQCRNAALSGATRREIHRQTNRLAQLGTQGLDGRSDAIHRGIEIATVLECHLSDFLVKRALESDGHLVSIVSRIGNGCLVELGVRIVGH